MDGLSDSVACGIFPGQRLNPCPRHWPVWVGKPLKHDHPSKCIMNRTAMRENRVTLLLHKEPAFRRHHDFSDMTCWETKALGLPLWVNVRGCLSGIRWKLWRERVRLILLIRLRSSFLSGVSLNWGNTIHLIQLLFKNFDSVFTMDFFLHLLLFLFIYFWSHPAACGILVPSQGLTSCPLHRKCRVLTTELPRKSLTTVERNKLDHSRTCRQGTT